MYASELTTLDSEAELTLPFTDIAQQHVFTIAFIIIISTIILIYN